MGRPESVVKCSLRSAGGLVLVSDIFVLRQLLCDNRERANAGRGKPRPYNLLARRNELTAKKNNNRAKATAPANGQRETSRVQERRARFSKRSPRTAKHAPATSRKSCLRARQKR